MGQKVTEQEIVALMPAVDQISDSELRAGVVAIWQEIAEEMAWNDLRDVPKNVALEAGRSLLEHIRGVTEMALALCESARAVQGKDYDKDLLIAACLLHDASKPVETEPGAGSDDKAGGARKSALGAKIQHAVYAAHKVFKFGLPLELAHLLITHTHHSNTRGKSWEAAALFYADFADTDAALSASGDRMYSERWRLPG